MLSLGLQNIDGTFFLSLTPLKVLNGNLFVVCGLPNTLILLFFAVSFVTGSVHLSTYVSSSKNIIRTLLLAFWPCLTIFILYFEVLEVTYMHRNSLFVERVQKRYCYLSMYVLTSKHTTSILFNVFFSLNMFFLPLSPVLTYSRNFHSKYTKHTLFLCCKLLKA